MTLKSKMIRRLLVLATASALLAGAAGGFYVHRKLAIRSQFAQWKAQGLSAAAENQNAQAVDLLQHYLQRYPDDIDALAGYARVRPLVPLPKNQQIPDTIYALRHLLQQPKAGARPAEKRQLLDLYVRIRYWTEAQALSWELLPAGKSAGKTDGPILAARTAAYAAQRDWTDALVWATQASALAPTDLKVQVGVLDLVHQTHDFAGFSKYADHGKLTEVELANGLAAACQHDLARQRPAGSPGTQPTTDPASTSVADPRPAIIRGHGLALSGKIENAPKAIAFFKSAAACPSMDRDTAVILISELDRLGDSTDALPVLQRLARQTNEPLLHEALARQSWESGDWQSVIDATANFNPADPSCSSETLALRASALDRLGRSADAAPITTVLAARNDDPVALAWAFVLAHGNSGQHTADLRQLRLLCAAVADQSAYLASFQGDAEAGLGDSEEAIAAFQKATEQNVTWVAPAIRLAELLADAGRYESALQAGREAVRRRPTYPAIVVMFRAWDLCVQNGLAGNADQLVQDLGNLKKNVQDDGQILCLWADVLGTTGKTPDAAAAIGDGLKAGEKTLSQDSLLRLAAISRKYKLGVEQACLASCRAHYGVTPPLAYAAASAELAAGNAVGASKIFESDRASATTPQSVEWQLAWARYLDLAQDPRAAQQIVQLADREPADVKVQMQALTARSTRQNRDFAQRTIERVRRLTGENAVAWQLAKARWLLNFSNTDADRREASALLSNVVRLSPDQPEAHVLLSICSERDGRVIEAIDQMRVARGLVPNAPALSLSLARLLEIHGEFDAARDQLARIGSMPASDTDQRRSAAILATEAGDPRLALTLAQDAVSQSATVAGPGNQDLLLAQLYFNGGKVKEAEAICQKLLERPDLPTVQFAADLYAAQGRLDDATKVLALLDTLKLEPGIKQLTLADFSGRYVSADAAMKQLEQATNVAGHNPQTWKALITFYLATGQPAKAVAAISRGAGQIPADPVLESLREQQDLMSVADADPGLRPLAMAILRDPLDPLARDVLRRVVDDLKAKMSPSALADDVKLLADQHPQFLPLWMYLVQCDWNAGRTEDATGVALRTAQQFPAAAEPQQLYVSLLRNQQRWPEVLAEAQKWRDRSMSQPIAADLQIAEAEIKLKRPGDALHQLDPYVRNARSFPEAYPAILSLVAEARQMTGNTGTAALMEPLLRQGSRGRQVWMSFAVENLDPPEAAAWLDRVEPLIPADDVGERVALAGAWAALVHNRQYSPGSGKSVSIIKPLVERPDAPEALMVAYASDQESSGQLKEAEIYYRRALKLVPNDLIAMNNLAMVLAHAGGDLKEALSLARAAVQQRPDVSSLYDTLAFVQGKMQRYDDAAASAQTAIKMLPGNVQYRVTLAQLRLDSRKPAEAAQALRDLDAQHPDLAGQPAALRQQIDSIRAALKGERAQATDPNGAAVGSGRN